MRFEEIRSLRTERGLTMQEAAVMLGICERTFRRWNQRYNDEGAEGLADKRLERAAHNAASVDEVMALVTLFETHYCNYTVAHFYDKYRDKHEGSRCYTWVKNQLQGAGHVKKAKKRGVHRRKRERKPLAGMMLHQDASTHLWVPGVYWDLIVTMDDATSEIYSAFFAEEEGTWSSFQGVQEVIENHGLFCSFYSDRGSHYWHTPKAGGKVDKNNPTQFGRAMNFLGIEMIAAYSPEARGRSERVFGTLQGRLPKELAAENITTMFDANQFLKDVYIPEHNRKFKVEAAEKESAFVRWLTGNISLNDILCIQEQRTVNNDNTVSYQGKIYQIPKNKERMHYIKAKVRIHEYADQSIAIYHGQKLLGKFKPSAEIIINENKEVKQQQKNVAA